MRMSAWPFRTVVICSLAWVGGVPPCAGQDLYQNAVAQRGFPPNAYFSFDKLEAISQTTGELTYRIPLAHLPAGRAGLSLGLNLIYNGALLDFFYWTSGTSGVAEPILSQFGGWQYGYNYSLYAETRPLAYTSPDCEGQPGRQYFQKLSLITPDGSRHLLKMYGQSDYDGDGYYQYDRAGVGGA